MSEQREQIEITSTDLSGGPILYDEYTPNQIINPDPDQPPCRARIDLIKSRHFIMQEQDRALARIMAEDEDFCNDFNDDFDDDFNDDFDDDFDDDFNEDLD